MRGDHGAPLWAISDSFRVIRVDNSQSDGDLSGVGS